MKLKMTKEWLLKNIDKEDKAIVSAGGLSGSTQDMLEQPAHKYPPKEAGAPLPALGRLISLSRRNRGWSPEKLAAEARIDLDELVSIEQVSNYVPEPRTVCQLAKVLHLSEESMLELSGNTVCRNQQLQEEAVKFAARAQSLERLSKEEKRALEEFVKQLAKEA